MNSTDFSWLHLSDFHLGKDDYAQCQILEYILAEVDAAIAANRKPDFVFITGDLANKGQATEFELFDKEFLVPLMEKLGDSHLGRVFLVPGNHDVDRSKSRAVKRYDVLDEIQIFLDPTAEGREEREQILSRFKAFDEHPWYLEQQKWVTSADGYHAKRVTLPSYEVGILCINTAWFCGGDNEAGKLNPGLGMLEQGLRELAGCEQIFVLGHHPVHWLIPNAAQRFLAMLGKAGAIYLYGHLHKTGNLSQNIGHSTVLCLQAGCAFYARNDEQWLTRLLWGGFECSTQQVHVQPKKWNADHREWVLDADAFPNSLRAVDGDFWILPTRASRPDGRQSLRVDKKSSKVKITPPEGWVSLDASYLTDRRQPVTDDRILQYFEGRVPQWEDILSGSIPSRSIVDDLVATVTHGFEANEPQLTLLLGAGGEGKSTAFLQTLERITSNQQVKILWRSNPEKPMPPSFVTSLSATGDTWLLASDEGDSLINETFQVLRGLGRKSKIHVFLACRDTDWIENHGNDFMWNQVAGFAERRMKGLDERDAREIVNAWAKLGSRGLGKLAGSTTDEAVSQLVEAARVEATTSDGAFLGAMLRVRVGVALRDHVAALMVRLESREITGLPGKTLLDAFAYIAIPHAFNLLFLSKSVLGKAIGIDESRVRRRILGPLGEEAAAASAGQFILTRHRAIAEVAMEIAASRFEIDPEDILSDLVRSAITANEEGALVPHLKDWRYLSSRMFEHGNQSLGVRLAGTALAADSKNSYLAVKLAQLYREAGQAEQSANVFRKSYEQAEGNRAFYTEWATCEGSLGNRALSIWINAISLADGTERRPPDVKDVGFGLTGTLVNFLALFERYQNPIFLDAAAAADKIARRITLPKAAFDEIELRQQALIDFHANLNVSSNRLLGDLLLGIGRAHDQREMELSAALPHPSRLEFEALKEIARLKF
jgi:predicted MPP superfamily phosphohydrolase